MLEKAGDQYDPIIAARFRSGEAVSAADYIDVMNARDDLIARAAAATAPFDAVVMPTLALVAPPIAALEEDEDLWRTTNALIIRNTSVANFLDRCALTLPCHRQGDAPVGLKTIAAAVGESEDTIEEVFEPHLLRCGFLRKTARGREITPGGKRTIDWDDSEEARPQGELFS